MGELPPVDDQTDVGEVRRDRIEDAVPVVSEEDLAHILRTLGAGDVADQGHLVQPAVLVHSPESPCDHGVSSVRTDGQPGWKGLLLPSQPPPDAYHAAILPRQITHLEVGRKLGAALDGDIQQNGIQ